MHLKMEINATAENCEHGIITRTRSYPETHRFSGCVHYQNGEICKRSQRPSSGVVWKPVDRALTDSERDNLPLVTGRAVYAGHLPEHFGHFLLETPARFWFLTHFAAWDHLIFNRFVTGGAAESDDEKLGSLLASHDIGRDRVRLLDRDTRFSAVLVPDALLELGSPVPRLLMETYQRWRAHLLKNAPECGPRRVYLSRRKFEQDGGQSGVDEAAVESLFQELGFTIVHPQLLPFTEQVRLVAGAEAIAGLGGSALHLAVFLQSDALTLVICTRRWPGINRVQTACAEISSSRLAFFPFSGDAATDPDVPTQIDRHALKRFVTGHLDA